MSMIGYYTRIKKEQLEEVLKFPEKVPEILFNEENEGNSVDIDKAWHGIHFLLTGDPWEGVPPLSYVVLGGQPLEYELEYGPPRYITPSRVKEACEALNQLSREEIEKRYNPEKFEKAEIYPEIWNEDGEELDYLLHYLEEIKKFFTLAIDKDEAIVFYIF